MVRPAAVLVAALAAGALALPALPAGAHHVPPAAFVVELPEAPGVPRAWLCFGGLFWQERFQVGPECRFWCVTDGGCAVFYTDFDYAGQHPFAIQFVDVQGQTVHRHSGPAGGPVCIYWYEMLDLHFTFLPEPVAAGSFGHVFAVKDEGQYCEYPYGSPG